MNNPLSSTAALRRCFQVRRAMRRCGHDPWVTREHGYNSLGSSTHYVCMTCGMTGNWWDNPPTPMPYFWNCDLVQDRNAKRAKQYSNTYPTKDIDYS